VASFAFVKLLPRVPKGVPADKTIDYYTFGA
jgi:hypothetical protein